jgi:hypothetical protein
MSEKEFCSNCSHDHDCKSIYEHMGKARGPSVVWKVFWVFLFPILFFIVNLCVFERLLANSIVGDLPRAVVSFLISLGLSFVSVVVVSQVFKRLARKTDSCSLKEADH